MTLLVNSKSGERHYQTEVFPLSVGNIDYLSCLGKLEHPYESRISQQSHLSRPPPIYRPLPAVPLSRLIC